MGNPNVGKSALFSRLTGVDVIVSNYPGTTIEFKKGRMKFDDQLVEVIDVPGTYSLEAASRAEEVTVSMLKEGDLVINVVDATKPGAKPLSDPATAGAKYSGHCGT